MSHRPTPRIRLPQRLDAARLQALCARLGLAADELWLRRVLRFDPRRRVVLIATILVGRTEEAVGVTMMDRDANEPDLVLCDEAMAPGIRAHLEATVARSAAWPPSSSPAWSR